MNAKQLYWDARESYINGNYLSTIMVVGSTIEATIIGKIDPTLFNANNIDPTRLNLNALIELAKTHGYFDTALTDDLHDFRHIRNYIVHSQGDLSILFPFELTHYSGKTPHSRSMGYTHPEIAKAIKGKTDAEAQKIVAKMTIEDKEGKSPQEAAEWGLDLFFQVREKFY